MISVTLTFNTRDEAVEFLTTGNHQGFVASVSAPTAEPKPEKKKSTKGKKADKPTPAAKAEAPAADAEEVYEAVKTAALKLTHTKGRDKLVEVLAAHGFKTAMDAPAEAYPALIADMEAATTATDEELV